MARADRLNKAELAGIALRADALGSAESICSVAAVAVDARQYGSGWRETRALLVVCPA
jgi:hypothetical protein